MIDKLWQVSFIFCIENELLLHVINVSILMKSVYCKSLKKNVPSQTRLIVCIYFFLACWSSELLFIIFGLWKNAEIKYKNEIKFKNGHSIHFLSKYRFVILAWHRWTIFCILLAWLSKIGSEFWYFLQTMNSWYIVKSTHKRKKII